MERSPSTDAGARPAVRREARVDGPLELYEHAEWRALAPGVVCGITGADNAEDFGVGGASTAHFLSAYRSLARALRFQRVAVCRQVHGSRVVRVQGGLVTIARGSDDSHASAEIEVSIPGDADGLVTDSTGLLLAVTVADCVPVYLLDPRSGAVGLLHSGWRGTAAGVLEQGLRTLCGPSNAGRSEIRIHLGPAICGRCYEVGEEVLSAFGRSGHRAKLDLRAELGRRALRSGVEPDRITISSWCTRCDRSRFHSHRAGGDRAGRMAAFLGRVGG